jgi:hypothetical protein
MSWAKHIVDSNGFNHSITAVIVEEAKAERLADLTLPPTSGEILQELRETQAVLTRMRAKLERLERE